METRVYNKEVNCACVGEIITIVVLPSLTTSGFITIEE
jgi:hypothetical protein